MYSWIAFWKASFFTGIQIASDWGFGDWSSVASAGELIPLSALELDSEITLLSNVVFGVLLKARLGIEAEAGLGPGLLDL